MYSAFRIGQASPISFPSPLAWRAKGNPTFRRLIGRQKNPLSSVYLGKWRSKFQRAEIVVARRYTRDEAQIHINSPWLGDCGPGSSTCQTTCFSLPQPFLYHSPRDRDTRNLHSGSGYLDHRWEVRVGWLVWWARHAHAHYQSTVDTCVHAAGDSLRLWLPPNGRKWHICLIWKIYVCTCLKKKNICTYTYKHLWLGNFWKDLQEIICSACLCKTGERSCEKGIFRFYLKPFLSAICVSIQYLSISTLTSLSNSI